jgi:hypothetical protein
MGLLPAPRMQVFPLVCSRCGEPMRIIAFGTEVGSVHRILAHLGEPTNLRASPRPPAVLPWQKDFEPRQGTDLSSPAPV